MNTVYGRNFYTKRNSNESNPEGNEEDDELQRIAKFNFDIVKISKFKPTGVGLGLIKSRKREEIPVTKDKIKVNEKQKERSMTRKLKIKSKLRGASVKNIANLIQNVDKGENNIKFQNVAINRSKIVTINPINLDLRTNHLLEKKNTVKLSEPKNQLGHLNKSLKQFYPNQQVAHCMLKTVQFSSESIKNLRDIERQKLPNHRRQFSNDEMKAFTHRVKIEQLHPHWK